MRGETFVTRKITRAIAAIKRGQQTHVELGNLDAKRDWGHARDYVEGMWKILQHEIADDFVLATGQTHSVRDFVEAAFALIGHDIQWQGSGVQETGISKQTNQILVTINPKFFRPTELDILCGDPSKAKKALDWQAKTSFQDLVKEMVEHDLST